MRWIKVNPSQNQNQFPSDAELNLDESDKVLDEVAKNLAVSLAQEEFRSFIKTEALRKFDGDYNILYSQIKNSKVAGKNFRSFVQAGDGSNDIASSVPLLNVAVPVNIENWDTKEFTPLVAVIYSSYDEEKTELVKAYDQNGKVHWLDAKKEPN